MAVTVLALSMFSTTCRTCSVPPSCRFHALLSGCFAALRTAINLPAPAGLANVENSPASRTSAVPQRLHTPPAGTYSLFTESCSYGNLRGLGRPAADLTVCAVLCSSACASAGARCSQKQPDPRTSHDLARTKPLTTTPSTPDAAAWPLTTDCDVQISSVLNAQRQWLTDWATNAIKPF